MAKVAVEKLSSSGKRKHPVLAEIEDLGDRVRERAYQLFAKRGSRSGDPVGDWLEAERQVCGPACELIERPDGFDIRVALAGFVPGDVSVLAAPGEIVVRAAHQEKSSKKRKQDDSVLHFSEFLSASVLRRMPLPSLIDVDKVKAKLNNGVLEIDAPKPKKPGKPAKKSKSEAKKKANKKPQKKVKSRKKD